MRLAVTLDDVPWQADLALPHFDALLAANEQMRVALEGVPATVFVCPGRLDASERSAALGPWVDAGFSIGNHTATHRVVGRAPLVEWAADVAEGHRLLRAIGVTPRWFRYPRLFYGGTRAEREAAWDAVTDLGLEVAHATLPTSDWLLGTRDDDAAVARWLDHLARCLDLADPAGDEVLVLHANRLNARAMPAVVALLRARATLVPLEAVYAPLRNFRPFHEEEERIRRWLAYG